VRHLRAGFVISLFQPWQGWRIGLCDRQRAVALLNLPRGRPQLSPSDPAPVVSAEGDDVRSYRRWRRGNALSVIPIMPRRLYSDSKVRSPETVFRTGETMNKVRLLAFTDLNDFERNPLPFVESAIPGALYGLKVDEHVLAATVTLNEAISLFGAEPFDRSRSHKIFP
jgi:hypothetical protein